MMLPADHAAALNFSLLSIMGMSSVLAALYKNWSLKAEDVSFILGNLECGELNKIFTLCDCGCNKKKASTGCLVLFLLLSFFHPSLDFVWKYNFMNLSGNTSRKKSAVQVSSSLHELRNSKAVNNIKKAYRDQRPPQRVIDLASLHIRIASCATLFFIAVSFLKKEDLTNCDHCSLKGLDVYSHLTSADKHQHYECDEYSTCAFTPQSMPFEADVWCTYPARHLWCRHGIFMTHLLSILAVIAICAQKITFNLSKLLDVGEFPVTKMNKMNHTMHDDDDNSSKSFENFTSDEVTKEEGSGLDKLITPVGIAGVSTEEHKGSGLEKNGSNAHGIASNRKRVCIHLLMEVVTMVLTIIVVVCVYDCWQIKVEYITFDSGGTDCSEMDKIRKGEHSKKLTPCWGYFLVLIFTFVYSWFEFVRKYKFRERTMSEKNAGTPSTKDDNTKKTNDTEHYCLQMESTKKTIYIIIASSAIMHLLFLHFDKNEESIVTVCDPYSIFGVEPRCGFGIIHDAYESKNDPYSGTPTYCPSQQLELMEMLPCEAYKFVVEDEPTFDTRISRNSFPFCCHGMFFASVLSVMFVILICVSKIVSNLSELWSCHFSSVSVTDTAKMGCIDDGEVNVLPSLFENTRDYVGKEGTDVDDLDTPKERRGSVDKEKTLGSKSTHVQASSSFVLQSDNCSFVGYNGAVRIHDDWEIVDCDCSE